MHRSPLLRLGSSGGGGADIVATAIAKAGLWAASTVGCTALGGPFGSLVGCGCMFRLATLSYSIYGDKCLARIACALPEVHVAFQQYNAIANHPRAILWEKKVAAQKLQNDRNRIFREHRTSNVLIVLPHAMASAVSGYLLFGLPSQTAAVLSGYAAAPLGSAATASGAGAALSSSSSFATALVLSLGVDPTLAIAATITLGNCWYHLHQRRGFNDMLDNYVRLSKRGLVGTWAAVCVTSLVVAPAFFPAYVGPVWLGMSLVGVLKVLINATAPLRFLFGIADYPPEHGTYGREATAVAHEYRLAVTSFDAEEQYRTWCKAKKTMEFECDARIYGGLKKLGVFTELEEFEHEREKTGQKIDITRQRRQQAEQQQLVAKERGGPNGGYFVNEALAASMEAQLEEEKQRRIARHTPKGTHSSSGGSAVGTTKATGV